MHLKLRNLSAPSFSYNDSNNNTNGPYIHSQNDFTKHVSNLYQTRSLRKWYPIDLDNQNAFSCNLLTESIVLQCWPIPIRIDLLWTIKMFEHYEYDILQDNVSIITKAYELCVFICAFLLTVYPIFVFPWSMLILTWIAASAIWQRGYICSKYVIGHNQIKPPQLSSSYHSYKTIFHIMIDCTSQIGSN